MDNRVLVVDDDPAAVRLVAKHLTDSGHQVLTATNGLEAMRVLLAEAPSIVITDWMMPEMDGLELCRAIRAHQGEGLGFVYVIMITAYKEDDQIIEAFEAGADDYLSKPLNFKALFVRLRAAQRIVQLQEDVEKRNRQVQRFNAEMEIMNNGLAGANQKLRILATQDELTGLTNRRAAMSQLHKMWALSVRHDSLLSCILLDIDHFKKVNDTYGHDVGDLVLRGVADKLEASTREGETVARIGGEEFLVLCPGSDVEVAAGAAERLRRVIEGLRIEQNDSSIRVTISLGVAHRSAFQEDPDSFLKVADQALYEAKRSGRNRVCRASEEGFACEADTPAQPARRQESPASSEPCESAGSPALPFYDFGESEPGKVLVVAEDDQVRSAYLRRLEQEGYVVAQAANGADALKRAQSEGPDVILLDAMVQDMDASTCLDRLKSHPDTNHIPVILTGRRSDAGVLQESLRAGADDYLSESLSAEELALRLKTTVRLHHSRKQLLLSNQNRGEQARAMGLLLDFSRDLAAGEDLATVMERIVAVSAELTCSRCVSVMLPDADNRYLSMVHSLGMERRATAGKRFPITSGLTGHVYSTGGLMLADMEGKEHGCIEEEGHLFRGGWLISAALVVSGNVVGVLNAGDRRGGRAYTALDVEYIDLVRGIAASAVHSLLNRQARDEARDSVVVALAKLAEHRDTDTGKHLDRVTKFSLLLAEHLRATSPYRDTIDDEFLHNLERAVPLHDIGKVAVPDNILLKPGRRTPDEIAIMQRHVEVGAGTLRSLVERSPGIGFLRMAEVIAHSHHERYDGKGYPQGLQGEEIPLAARIASLADVYDAITTKRVYKEAMSHQEAVAIIRSQAGKQFDSVVTDAFLHREGEFATLAVELADGATDAPARPRRTPSEEHAQAPLVAAS